MLAYVHQIMRNRLRKRDRKKEKKNNLVFYVIVVVIVANRRISQDCVGFTKTRNCIYERGSVFTLGRALLAYFRI